MRELPNHPILRLDVESLMLTDFSDLSHIYTTWSGLVANGLYTVLSKCSNFIPGGKRLENLSWRFMSDESMKFQAALKPENMSTSPDELNVPALSSSAGSDSSTISSVRSETKPNRERKSRPRSASEIKFLRAMSGINFDRPLRLNDSDFLPTPTRGYQPVSIYYPPPPNPDVKYTGLVAGGVITRGNNHVRVAGLPKQENVAVSTTGSATVTPSPVSGQSPNHPTAIQTASFPIVISTAVISAFNAASSADTTSSASAAASTTPPTDVSVASVQSNKPFTMVPPTTTVLPTAPPSQAPNGTVSASKASVTVPAKKPAAMFSIGVSVKRVNIRPSNMLELAKPGDEGAIESDDDDEYDDDDEAVDDDDWEDMDTNASGPSKTHNPIRFHRVESTANVAHARHSLLTQMFETKDVRYSGGRRSSSSRYHTPDVAANGNSHDTPSVGSPLTADMSRKLMVSAELDDTLKEGILRERTQGHGFASRKKNNHNGGKPCLDDDEDTSDEDCMDDEENVDDQENTGSKQGNGVRGYPRNRSFYKAGGYANEAIW